MSGGKRHRKLLQTMIFSPSFPSHGVAGLSGGRVVGGGEMQGGGFNVNLSRMKISVAWLNEYLDRAVSADEIEHRLTEQVFPIDAREVLPGGDVMLDVEVTSNRPDCLSHVGLAREVAAGVGATLKPPTLDLPAESGEPVASLTSVTNEAQDLCPLYTARVIRGVKIGPSPAWLVQRLEAIGLRSVNNVVDVTNFVLHELGQPLHAFDMAKLAERRIVVRRAREGETIVAIDGTKHTLRSDMLVIADAQKPVAVAGVMGGLDSEVSDSTTDILLESAMFDPLSIRRTSRTLKLASDSSYRFERGVDPAGVDAASRRAAALIVELAGGTLAPGVVCVGIDVPQPHTVMMRPARCNALLGVEIPTETMLGFLSRLGLSPRLEGDAIVCTVPTYRLDLQREVDLIEEVGRLHGLGDVPVRTKIEIVARPVQSIVAARRKLNEVLVAHGYHETITFSFVNPKLGGPFVEPGCEAVNVDDERRKSEPMLRPSLVPSLLLTRKRNQDAGNTDVLLAETASVWNRRDGGIIEEQRLALLADAEDASEALRRVRGTIEEVVQQLMGADVMLEVQPAERGPFATAGRVVVDGEPVGWLGLISPKVQALFDLQTQVVAAELDLPKLLAQYPPQRRVSALPRFPGIERDLSVIVDERVSWQAIESHVLAVKPPLLEQVNFLTTYRGKPIAKGQKSVSFRMLFRDPDKTLRHDEVDPQVASVVERLRNEVGATLRT